jgi:pimeloyl-ACP methyl ester carboxylesterase
VTTSLTIETAGGPLAVVEAVPADRVRGTVVLVPGFTGSKEDFRLVLEPLAAAGYRAVAYDQRGQFESPGSQDPADYAVEALAADLLGLVAQLGAPRVHVVGHSFGGLVARAAVLHDPTAVTSLTLLASGPSGLTGPRAEVLDLFRPLLADAGLAGVADALDAAAAQDPRRSLDPPELRAFLRRRFLASSQIGLVAMAEALLSEPDRVEELHRTAVPLLVAYGEHDDAWLPAVQAAMAERLGARCAVIPGAFHSPATEQPAATVAHLTSFFADAEQLGEQE